MDLKRRILPAGIAITMLLTGCSQTPQAREAKYLDKGKKEFRKKNYAVAVLHFKNAVEAMPRDAEPYYQLGLAYLASNDFNTAASYFRKATELNPTHTGAQLKLAELMATSRSKDIVEEAEKRTQDVLTLLPEDTDALDILAVTELRLGKPQSAEAHLEQALRKSPTSLRSSIALAQTRLTQKDVAGAEDALKQAVAQAPKSPEPKVYLGGFYMALGRTADAEQQYRSALELDPKHGPTLLALGALQVRTGKSAEAEETYRRVAALPDSQYKPVHALYLFQSGKKDQAIAEFEKLAKSNPADRNLRTDLVKAYLASNRVADAEKVLTAALKKNGLDTDALLQRCKIYLAGGKFVEAQADLNQVLHYHADWAEAHYLFSKVRQGRGEAALRQQELGETLRLDPEYLMARLELAQILTAGGGASSALKLLDETPADQKGTARVVVERNWALLALGQTADARKGIDAVLSTGKVPEALLQDAAMKLTQKDYAGARASAEEALDQDPGNVRALHLLVQDYATQNQLPAGLQKAREFAAKQPNAAGIQLYLGQLLATTGDRAGARKAFEAAKAANPDLVYAQLALAELDTTEAKWDDARKRLDGVVASQPSNVPAHLLLGQLEMNQGKRAPAIDQFRRAVELSDGNALALNALAYLLAENKQADEALKYAQKAKELAPNNPAVDDTLGWTYFQKGMYSLAVTNLEDATAKDGTAVRKYHLAMAYLKAGDRQRGRLMFDAALKMDPNLPEAQMARQAFGVN
jgi:tetratricopeptide (TPR) repeat protein